MSCSSDSPSAAPDAAPAQTPPAASNTSATGAVRDHGAEPTIPGGEDGVVVSVTDGDTIRVRLANGTVEKVRLTGIDTPETRDPRRPVECFGEAASAHTKELLPIGTAVRLERDVELRDRYQRLLSYVWRVSDALFVNAALVRDGFAAPYRYPPNVKYADEFSLLGRQAREAGVGLWSACGGTNTPATAVTAAPSATPPPNAGGDCDPNYAGACVPVSSSDLDCGDVGARRFQVIGADPHGFDGDHDGVACE